MMMTQIVRVTCPGCGRAVGIRRDNHAIASHGPHGRKCAASSLTAIDGPLTAKQLAYLRHCWLNGDALPVARLFGVGYAQPEVPADMIDPDRLLWFLVDSARHFIAAVVRDYRERWGCEYQDE